MLVFQETMRPTEFKQVTLDRHGNLYVGGTNAIYKLSPGLTLYDHDKDQVVTGPTKDGLNCSPGNSDCRSATLTDNDAVILEAIPNAEYLLFCGSVHQGLCYVYSMADLNTKTTLESSNVVNLIGNRESAVAFFGQGDPQFSDGHTLYVGMSYDNRPVQFSPKALSARELKQDSTGRFSLSYSYEANGLVSGIDIDSNHKRDYIVRYIYGFEHEGFSYFVTVQREDLFADHFVTKLVRVCQKDPRFYSYTEVDISCRKAELDDTFYNIAQAAYLSPVGRELETKFNLARGEQVLFVVSGKGDDGYDTANKTYGHGVCMYTMSEIRKTFRDVQLKCYQGYGSLLPWITRGAPKCRFDVRNNK